MMHRILAAQGVCRPLFTGRNLGLRLQEAAYQIIKNLKSRNPWHFLWLFILLTEILTAIMNTLMGLLWWGTISYDLLMIGTVDAFIISFIVVSVVISLLNRTADLSEARESLQNEMTQRQRAEETLRDAQRDIESQLTKRTLALTMMNAQLTREIAGQRKTESALRKSERFLNNIFDSFRDPFCIIDRDYRILRINEDYARIRNSSVDRLTGSRCYEVLYSRKTVCENCLLKKTFHSGNCYVKDKVLSFPNGEAIWIEIYTYPIFDENGTVSHVIHHAKDITSRKRGELEKKRLIEKLDHLSRTDGLTGLLSRRALIQRLEYEIDKARRDGSELSLILCDIDYFKEVNDTFGHVSGDMVLQNIAQILREPLRITDSAGRYGGDEFMLLLPKAPVTDAEMLAEDIRYKVENTDFGLFSDRLHKVTLSLGAAHFSPATNSIDTFIRNADAALYMSKQAGRNRVSVTRRCH